MGKKVPAVRSQPGKATATTAARHDRTVQRMTRVFKSLADPYRVKIMYMLSKTGEMHVSAISDELGHSQPAVSHHLTQLRNAGLIDYRRDGKYNHYFLDTDGIADLLGLFFPQPGPNKLFVDGFEVVVKRKS